MNTTSAVVSLLAQGGENPGHENLNPYLTGLGAFLFLMLLLWITTRFNRD